MLKRERLTSQLRSKIRVSRRNEGSTFADGELLVEPAAGCEEFLFAGLLQGTVVGELKGVFLDFGGSWDGVPAEGQEHEELGQSHVACVVAVQQLHKGLHLGRSQDFPGLWGKFAQVLACLA